MLASTNERMGSAPYALDQWYAAAFADEVTRQPLARWTLDKPPSAVHAKAGGFTMNVDRWFVVRYVKPTTVLIDVGSAPIGSGAPQGDRSKGIGLFSNGTITPSVGNSTYYFWHTARNFGLNDAELTEFFQKEMTRTFLEDVELTELVKRNVDCDVDAAPQLNIAGDVVALRARRIIAALIEAEALRESVRVG